MFHNGTLTCIVSFRYSFSITYLPDSTTIFLCNPRLEPLSSATYGFGMHLASYQVRQHGMMRKIMSQPKTTKAIDTSIGLKIQQLRIAKGVSRQSLAENIGITHQQLQKYEKGVNRISASRLLDIAQQLEVSIIYFFEDVVSDLPQHVLQQQRIYVDLVRDFAKITRREQQDAIRKLVQTIATAQA